MSKKVAPHVLARYEVGQLLGSGAYGYVWQAVEKKTGRRVALKKIFGAFRDNTDAQRTYREVEILKGLRHRNIVSLLEVLGGGKGDLYLVMELMEADLQAVVGSNILGHSHQTYLLFQLLKATAYLNKKQLLHRDLKPSNLLIDSNCTLKVCDFGLARSLYQPQNQENVLSQEVATKWYRSPQLLLGSRHYSYPVDCWSVGCIAAELLTGRPLFSGSSTLEQLELMIAYAGKLTKEDVDSLDSPVAQCLIAQIKVRGRNFNDYFGLIDPSFHPLLEGLLQFNPHKRMTAEQSLKLQIFADLVQEHGKNEEEIDQKPINLVLNENQKFNLTMYRQEVYRGISKELRGIYGSRVSHKAKGGSKVRPKSASQSAVVKRISQNSNKKPKKDLVQSEVTGVKKQIKLKSGIKARVSSSSSSKSMPKSPKVYKSPVKKIVSSLVRPQVGGKLRKKGQVLIRGGRPMFH